MRAVVKLEALRSLRTFIEGEIPELRGKVEVRQVPPEKHLGFPSLAIVTGGKFSYEPRTEGFVARSTPSSIVVDVGSWNTTVQLRLCAATPADSFVYQERLEGLFWRTENRPGVLLTTVTSCPQLGDILAAWDLGDTDWEDEMAFSSVYWSVLSLDAVIPALVTREGVYSIEELRLGITDDFAFPETSAAFDTLTGRVRINQDGTVTPI